MDGHLIDMAYRAVRHAESMQDVTYCDARAEERDGTSIRVENGKVDHVKNTSHAGIGIRMLLATRGTWRFVSISSPESWSDVRRAIDGTTAGGQMTGTGVRAGREGGMTARADAMAGTGTEGARRPVPGRAILCSTRPLAARVTYPVAKPPDQDAIMQLGTECGRAISDSPRIANSVTAPRYDTVSKYFASSEGADILQEHTDTTVSMIATATTDGTTRSMDATVGGRGGLEVLRSEDGTEAVARAAELASRAAELSAAGAAGQMRNADIVMNPSFVALLVHEIMGHPSEADRVMGTEMAWAGGAWWKGMLGRTIASDRLSVFDDPTIPGSLGHYAYDDEGVKTARTVLVRDGVLSGHMQSRETAAAFGASPTGNMRAAGYEFMPLIRMACTCIEPGDHTRDEMIRGIKDGYAIYDMRIPSIDMRRYNWSISCQYARRIINGEEAEMVRDVVVSGTAPDLFNSISACGRDFAGVGA